MNTPLHDGSVHAERGRRSGPFPGGELRQICLEAGASDVGFVEIERESLASERADMLRVYPQTRTLISTARIINRESTRSPSVSTADYEFAKVHWEMADMTGSIIRRLNATGVRAVALPPGFPMDMDRWPGKIWEVSHKPVAVEAGIGQMGIHRIVIHPQFGSHILLDTILIDAELDQYSRPLPENPCVECRLCVSVCPVGAISRDGEVHFMSCAMHNYHELFGGFQEWIEEMVASRGVKAYRSRFRDSETLTKWQSLTYGHFYRCSYCMAVCPAGEEPLKAYQANKKRYVQEIVKPLKTKEEPVYVIGGTSAEKAALRNGKKQIRSVRNRIRPSSIGSFLEGVPLLFNPEQAQGLHLTLTFAFTGKEARAAAITISEGSVAVQQGEAGRADLRVRVDSEAWLRIVNEELSPFWALLTGRLKLKGNPAHLKKFKQCML